MRDQMPTANCQVLTRDQAADIFSCIRKYATADEVECLFVGGRTARATTNRFDEESLRDVVKSSEALARVQEPDSDLLPLPDAGEGARATQGRLTQSVPSRHFEQTAALTPGQRA